MKKQFRHFFILWLSHVFTSGLVAQQDHVVLKNGDTLLGVVRNVGPKKMSFETTTTSMTIDNQEIELYYDSKKKETYCLRQINGVNKPVFVKRIIDGAIRMFVYTVVQSAGYPGVSTTTWFAEKDDIPFGEIKAGGLRGGKQDRKEFFKSLIADNPALVKRFDDDDKYKIDFLEQLVMEYNKQKSEN